MVSKTMKIGLLLIAAVLLVAIAFAGAGAAHAGTPVELTGESLTNYKVLVVNNETGAVEKKSAYTLAGGKKVYLLEDADDWNAVATDGTTYNGQVLILGDNLNFAKPDNDCMMTYQFTGKIYGNGYLIENFYNATSYGDDIGLIRHSGDGLYLNYVQMANSYLQPPGRSHVGTLIGEIPEETAATAIGCAVFGGYLITDGRQTGGLIGRSKGTLTMTHSMVLNTTIMATYEDIGGLIGAPAEKSRTIIFNCTVGDCWIQGKQDVGGLTGVNYDSKPKLFDRCKVMNSTIKGEGHIGGLIGGSTYGGAIKFSNCAAIRCDIGGTGTGVGGLVGYGNGGEMKDCNATYCSITGTGTGVGGLIGIAKGITATNCYALHCNVNGPESSTGGIVGKVENGAGSITNCHGGLTNDELHVSSGKGQAGDGTTLGTGCDNASLVDPWPLTFPTKDQIQVFPASKLPYFYVTYSTNGGVLGSPFSSAKSNVAMPYNTTHAILGVTESGNKVTVTFEDHVFNYWENSSGKVHDSTPITKDDMVAASWSSKVVYVIDPSETPKEDEYTSLEDAYSHVLDGGTIYLKTDVDLDKTFRIEKTVTIDGKYHTIRSTSDTLSDNHLIILSSSEPGANPLQIALQNLTIDFNKNPGDVFILDYYTEEAQKRKPVNLTNVKLTGMQTTDIFKTRSALHIDAANVTAVNLTIDQPAEPTLIDRWVSTIDMQATSGTHCNSNLTIDSLPYGAYCKGDPKAQIHWNTSGTITEVSPLVIELPLGDNLYVWPGFGATYEVTDWDDLANTIVSKPVKYGDTLKLKQDIISDGDPTEITIPKGVLINASRDGTMVNPYTINLASSDDHIVVNDLLGLASLLGYSSQVTYGKGYILAGQDLTFGELAKIPKDTKIWLERSHSKETQNNVTIQLPSQAIIPVDEYGLVSLRENKNLTIIGDGSITFTDDPLGNPTSLWVNGTLNFGVPVNQWPEWGINGTGTVNFFAKQDPMPSKFADGITVNFAPFAVSGSGDILCDDGTAIDVDTVVYKNGCAWSLSDNTITITTDDGPFSYTLSPASGYTGTWVVSGTSGTIGNARIFTAKFTKNVQPYTPSHREQGQTQIQQQVPVQEVSKDPTPANQATADITVNYVGQSVVGTSTSDIAAIKQLSAEAAAQMEIMLSTAQAAGIPLTNSKGAKAVVVTSENIPNVEKVTFSRVYEISPANEGEKLTKVTVKVPKSDVTSKGLTSEDVTVYHFLESYNIWVPLETLAVSQDENNYYYTAATDGTSPFGVLVKKIGETTAPTQTQKSPAPLAGIVLGLGAVLVLARMRR